MNIKLATLSAAAAVTLSPLSLAQVGRFSVVDTSEAISAQGGRSIGAFHTSAEGVTTFARSFQLSTMTADKIETLAQMDEPDLGGVRWTTSDLISVSAPSVIDIAGDLMVAARANTSGVPAGPGAVNLFAASGGAWALASNLTAVAAASPLGNPGQTFGHDAVIGSAPTGETYAFVSEFDALNGAPNPSGSAYPDGCVWVFDISNPLSPAVVQRYTAPVLTVTVIVNGAPVIFTVTNTEVGKALEVVDTPLGPMLLVGVPQDPVVSTIGVGRVDRFLIGGAGAALTLTSPLIVPGDDAGFGETLHSTGGRVAVGTIERASMTNENRPHIFGINGANWPITPRPSTADFSSYFLMGQVPGGNNATSIIGFDSSLSTIRSGNYRALSGGWNVLEGAVIVGDGTPAFDYTIVDTEGPHAIAMRTVQRANAVNGVTDSYLELLRSDFTRPEAYQNGTHFCGDLPNSTGNPGVLAATGSPLLSVNQVSLSLSDLPPNQFALVVTSTTQSQTSGGGLCLWPVARMDSVGGLVLTDALGNATIPVDFLTVPNIGAVAGAMLGETRYFQAYYRDVAGTSGFTNAVGFTVQ